MTLQSSEFSAGELVQVRSLPEIMRSLDERCCLDELPFMPEMLPYCGRQFRVSCRAHKTCDFVNKTGSRALPRAVHLEGMRCGGGAHGGCQAECTFYWKDAWLRRPGPEPAPDPHFNAEAEIARLRAATRAVGPGAQEGEPVYVCQATRLPAFTQPLSPWNPAQYIEDYRSGNIPSVVPFVGRAAYRALDGLINLGIGLGRPLRWAYDLGQRLLGRSGRYPGTPGQVPVGTKTPSVVLQLQVGELVRVKDHAAILKTIDQNGRNRGLSFSSEMTPYCGGTYRVHSRVNRIIDERTGRMLQMKNECIILEGVVCRAQFNKNMILCPRATYSYWREAWLERVESPKPARPSAPVIPPVPAQLDPA